MTRLHVLPVVVSVVVAIGSCGGGSSPGAGPSDSAAVDGGIDAAIAADTAQPEAGGAAEAGNPVDAAIDAPPGEPTINGCWLGGAEDHTAAADSRTIAFTGSNFSGKCMKVSVGQSVTWNAVFANHPLYPGVAPSSTGSGSSGNPITTTTTGSTVTFAFPVAGTFLYYCSHHQGFGMYGAVFVVP